jgi:chromosome segregation ATPase
MKALEDRLKKTKNEKLAGELRAALDLIGSLEQKVELMASGRDDVEDEAGEIRAKLMEEIGALKERTSSLVDEASRKDLAIRNGMRVIELQRKEISQLKEKLQAAEKKVSFVSKREVEAKGLSDERTETIRTLNARLNDVEGRLIDALRRNAKHVKRRDEALAEAKEHREISEFEVSENSKLLFQVRDANDGLRMANNEISSLRAQLSSRSRENGNLQANYDRRKDQLLDCEAALAQARVERDSARQSVDALNAELARVKEQGERRHDDWEFAEGQRHELAAELDRTREKSKRVPSFIRKFFKAK